MTRNSSQIGALLKQGGKDVQAIKGLIIQPIVEAS